MSAREISFEEYQAISHTTAIYPPTYVALDASGLAMQRLDLYPVLGLASEAGEFAGKMKKIVRDDHGVISEEKRQALLKELGDVLWYVAECVTMLDGNLVDVAEENVKKLRDRADRGKISGSGDER